MLVPVTVLALSLGLIHAASSDSSNSSNSTLDVDLGYTKYEGHKLSADSKVNQWLGMRYAAAPTGKLRFKAPQDPPTSDSQKADSHGAICHSTPSTKLNSTHSEDCLFLDVAAPADTDSGPYPVYFFIQGGGFNSLANTNLDPTTLMKAADYKIVIVTFNYRVGPWGFLASKEIKEDGDLNAGLLDQRKALQWVQDHIDKFGGDPDHVTIDGDSAGAASVDLHLTAYGGEDKGLFHAAIGQSNSFGAQLTVEESQYQYDGLVNRTGCGKDTKKTLDCLRNLDVAVIAGNNTIIPTPGAKGKPVFMYSNVIEGTGGFTEDYTYTMFKAGNFVKIPTIFGSVTNEGSIFAPTGTKTANNMKDFLRNNWVKLTDNQLDKIEKMYAKDTDSKKRRDVNKDNKPFDKRDDSKGAYWQAAVDAYGAIRYQCPAIFLNNMVNDQADKDANWHYQWNIVTAAHKASKLGVVHVQEVGALWGKPAAEEKDVTPIFQSFWASFIRSKDPNTHRLEDAPEWKTWGDSKARIVFPRNATDVDMKNIDSTQKTNCEYLIGIGEDLGQ